MQEGKKTSYGGSMKNVSRDIFTDFVYTVFIFFFLFIRLKIDSGLPWQQVTSQTLTEFIKNILKHVPLTFKTTFKCTIFIQLEETLK